MKAETSSGSQRQWPELSCRVLGPCYYQYQIFVSGFIFEEDCQIFMGIIIEILNCFRLATAKPSMKLSERHHVCSTQSQVIAPPALQKTQYPVVLAASQFDWILTTGAERKSRQ